MQKFITCIILLGTTYILNSKPMLIKTFETDEFQTKTGKIIRFHALMHSSIRIEYDSIEIMIDPCSELGGQSVDYSQMPRADIIFVTHHHHDHFDERAITLLSSDRTLLIMSETCTSTYGCGRVMKNGDVLQLTDDISVEAVPAYNMTESHLQYHPKGRDNGYILTFDGFRVYIAGDTEDIPEMASFKNIAIAFLPCNQPYTMTPDQLIKAAKIIKPRILFPYHYSETDISSIPLQLKSEGIDVRIRHYE